MPQGSCIGPLLFCRATDDLTPCDDTVAVKYSDDVSFIHIVRSHPEDQMQKEWDNIVEWSGRSGLTLNKKKCKILTITTKQSSSMKPVYNANGASIEEVEPLHLFGVTLSADMKWSKHFDNIVKKSSSKIYIIRNLRKAGCPKDLMEKAYVSLIRPLLLYAYPCMCNAPQFLKNRLVLVERRIAVSLGRSRAFRQLSSRLSTICAKTSCQSSHQLLVILFAVCLSRIIQGSPEITVLSAYSSHAQSVLVLLLLAMLPVHNHLSCLDFIL